MPPITGVNYKGLTIASAEPQGAAALAAHQNFQTLADFMDDTPSQGAVSIDHLSSPFQINVSHNSKLITANTQTASVTTILPNVNTIPNGFLVTLKKVASANALDIETFGSQEIDGLPSFTITDQNGFITLQSDGIRWHIIALFLDPAQINADALPMAFTPVNYTPATTGLGDHLAGIDGQLAAAVGAVDKNNLIVIEDRKSNGTAGQAITSGAWRTRDLNTIVSDTGSNASLASSRITLAAGTYLALISAPLGEGSSTMFLRSRLENVTDNATVLIGLNSRRGGQGNLMVNSTVWGIFTIAAGKELEIQSRVDANSIRTGAANSYGSHETYTQAIFLKLV